MRNRTPPSFTVETKSGGRHQRTFIPHRVVAPVVQRPAIYWPPPAEPKVPSTEPRRILPSLIATEPTQAEAERVQVSEERLPRPRRGRPPKDKPVTAEAGEESTAGAAVEITPPEAASPSVQRTLIAPTMRTVKPSVVLPLGERWKRRLGRWSL